MNNNRLIQYRASSGHVLRNRYDSCVDTQATTSPKTGYHVTILSNLAKGYDKYSRRYSKLAISESTYPDQFYLLELDDLSIGIDKAQQLLERVNLQGDRLIVFETRVHTEGIRPNLRNGLGFYIESNAIKIENLYTLDEKDDLAPIQIEEALAHSIGLLYQVEKVYGELRPRTVSILPVARGCQAACPFCFSKASVSAEKRERALSLNRIGAVIRHAKRCGAERLVITGGGEPGLLSDDQLEQIIAVAKLSFSNIVMITNGYKWSSMPVTDRIGSLNRLTSAGLKTLAISCHHFDPATNADLMGLDTGVENLLTDEVAASLELPLNLRLICVLQKGGVANKGELASYLDWAAGMGVREICFKELYVSTSLESVYHSMEANRWSQEHQVPLDLVTEFLDRPDWTEVHELPWGAPIYSGVWKGRPMQIAAYTEPSLFWELSHGVCRSWNLMADGICLASLEDKNSEVAVA